jgi:hypothetical protein
MMGSCQITPRRRYKHAFTVWAITGARAGLLLGIIGACIITADILYTYGFTGYATGLSAFAILVSAVIGLVSGLLIGMLNGLVLGLVSRTDFFRAQDGVMQGRVSTVTALTTGLGGFVVLYVLFKGDAIFVYPPAVMGTLLATFLGRRLPPIQQQPTSPHPFEQP